MTEATTGSTVPRRQLGRYLRDLRGKARMTVRAAAEALEWSDAKIWRIETGQTAMRSLDVEAICRVYGAPDDLTTALKALAKETKGRGWWHAYGDVIPDGFDLYIGLEEAVSELRWYEAELVPGLFQTAAYAHTLIRTDNPGVDDEEIERLVAVRMARQALLKRKTAAPTVAAVLDEAIVRRPVGGRDVMVEQLDRLVEIADLPTVSLRVVPFSAGLHHGLMSGPFVILRFPTDVDDKATEPPIVYVDGLTGELYLDKPNEIQRYDMAFTRIWDASLGEADSKELLMQTVRELSP
jgi:transcriptional regulator with XRE-family HTH domain